MAMPLEAIRESTPILNILQGLSPLGYHLSDASSLLSSEMTFSDSLMSSSSDGLLSMNYK